jgi:hypothetical protein
MWEGPGWNLVESLVGKLVGPVRRDFLNLSDKISTGNQYNKTHTHLAVISHGVNKNSVGVAEGEDITWQVSLYDSAWHYYIRTRHKS